MKFHILTLFPDMVMNGLHASIIGKAAERALIEINAVNIRDYTQDKHGKVDDYTYGGGAGMLLQAQPVFDAHQAVTKGRKVRTVYVTPQGVPFTQKLAMDFAKEEELLFLCGHYEGIDERALEEIVTDYVSIGDYVLTGGELPAMVMVDAISRLVPGVLGNEFSADTESFHNDLLEYPQYSRPEEWHGKKVPEILLSGDRRKIAEWRLEQAKERTKRVRPDLYKKYLEKEEVLEKLFRQKRNNIHLIETLSRGTGEILYTEGESLLVYNRICDIVLLTAENMEHGEKMISLVPKTCGLAVTSQSFLNDLLCERLMFSVCQECNQVCYTPRESLPVHHKDIRMLTREEFPYVAEHYALGDPDSVKERIDAKALYGAFVEGRIVGFAGIHEDGSMGMLYVDEKYRHQGIGAALESYIINREREVGHTPYAHIIVGNEESLRLQEKLGLYQAKQNIWWLIKKACISSQSMLDS